MKIKYLSLLIIFILSTNVSFSQNNCNCCSDKHQQFDFWLGKWMVYDTLGNKIGENIIEKIEDNCLVSEHWTGSKGTTGRSYNYYEASDSTWNQLWIDNKGGRLELKGKASKNKMILYSEASENNKGELIKNRISWIGNPDGTVSQIWDIVNDSNDLKTRLFEGIYKKESGFIKTVEFPSLDGILITANIYEIDKNAPVILLCHQARFNKFEYDGIALELNKLGFNCIAIDQRSGGPISSKSNETNLRARKAEKPTSYLDAEQDIIAAINYTNNYFDKPLILWGSSYSSTLALYLASSNDKVSAVISFSPCNYFAEQKGSLTDILPNLKKPMFITSSREESKYIDELLSKTTLGDNQIHFIPEGTGYHGSRSLWKGIEGGEEYWIAIKKFLSKLE